MAKKSGNIRTMMEWLSGRWDRVLYWMSAVKPLRFPLLLMAAGAFVLITVPQAQDVLRAFAARITDRWEVWPRIFLVFGTLVWVLSLWYWSRVMLTLSFPGVPGNDQKLRPFRTLAPRYLGFVAALSVAAALFKAASFYGDPEPAALLRRYAAGIFAGAFVYLYVVSKRRTWSRSFNKRLRKVDLLQKKAAPVVAFFDVKQEGQVEYGTKRAIDLPGSAKTIILLTLGLAVALFLLFTFYRQETAPIVGSASILLFALAGWTAAGSLMDVIGMRLRYPVLTSLLVLTAIFSFWNDNHAVRTLPTVPPALSSRMTVTTALERWYEHQAKRPSRDGTYPLFLVSAEGGGIRAAYWTAIVLAGIQDENPCFADSLFALSGVSGGSLGAAVFLAQVADMPTTDDGFRCDRSGSPLDPKGLQHTAKIILGEDFLSPALGAMLYPDLLQRALPFGFETLDRSRALEEGWEAAWKNGGRNNRFSEPLDRLWTRNDNAWMPALLLNSTWVETGKRLIVSNLQISPEDFSDAEDVNDFYTRESLPLSTAVHLSARFTYISPAGSLRKNGIIYGRAVDGGYFENSGTTAIQEILATLDLLAKDSPRWKKVRPIAVHISNEPASGGYDRMHLSMENDKKEAAYRPGLALNEVMSPPVTLMNTRGARGVYARESLEWFLGRDFLHFGLCKKDMSIPLGWALSPDVRNEMDAQIAENCAPFKNDDNMKDIQKVLPRQRLEQERVPGLVTR